MKLQYLLNQTSFKIYFLDHFSFIQDNVIKQGITDDIISRLYTYNTVHYHGAKITNMYEIYEQDKHKFDIKIKKYFKSLNKKSNGGTEFFNRIMINYFDKLLDNNNITYYKYTQEEIDEYLLQSTILNIEPNYSDISSLIGIEEIDNLNLNDFITKFDERLYQNELVDDNVYELLSNKKSYVNSPTGTGKTYSIYKIIKELYKLDNNIENFIIFSPRKDINTQNKENKYLNIINIDENNVYNKNSNITFSKFLQNKNQNKYNIIISCIQSLQQIKDIIEIFELKNIFVIFDEAHHSVENKIIESDKIDENTKFIDEFNNFWFVNNDIIKYRLYLSATPNIEDVEKYNMIFGKLYKKYSIKWFIEHGYLCPLKVFVQDEYKSNINDVEVLLNDFNHNYKENITGSNKFGFSFHGNCNNAFELFYEHMKLYIDGIVFVKPFLCISDYSPFKDKLSKINEKLKELNKEFEYKNIEVFKETENSLAYVVKMYTLGFNFPALDYICFTDKKYQYQDIIQCVGRVLRIDPNNPNKVAHITINSYIDEYNYESNEYSYLIKVLQFIQFEIGLEFGNGIEFTRNGGRRPNKRPINNNNDYNGEDFSKTIDILEKLNKNPEKTKFNKSSCKKFIKGYKLTSINQYKDLARKYLTILPLEPQEYFNVNSFDWFDYLSLNKNLYYNTIEEFEFAIKNILETNKELYNNLIVDKSLFYIKITEIDNKIISEDLFNELYNSSLYKLFENLTKKKRRM